MCRQYLSSWTSAMTLHVGCNTCRCRRWGRKRPSFLGFAALQCVLESARTLSPWRRAALRPDCQSSFCNSCGQGSRHHPIPKMGLVLPGRGLYGQNANTRSLLHKRLTESECIQEHDRQVLGESGLDSSSPWSLVLETQLNARSMVIYTWCAAVCLKKYLACRFVRHALLWEMLRTMIAPDTTASKELPWNSIRHKPSLWPWCRIMSRKLSRLSIHLTSQK